MSAPIERRSTSLLRRASTVWPLSGIQSRWKRGDQHRRCGRRRTLGTGFGEQSVAARSRMYRMERSAAYASTANSRCKPFPLCIRARGEGRRASAPLCELRPPIARISSPRKVIWRSDDLRLLDAAIASDSAPTGGAGGIWTHFPDGVTYRLTEVRRLERRESSASGSSLRTPPRAKRGMRLGCS
jgi:hypothetical protein